MTPKKIELAGHMETAFGASSDALAILGDIVTVAYVQGLDAGRPACPRPEAGRIQRAVPAMARAMAGTFML